LWRQAQDGVELVRFEFGSGQAPVYAHRSILTLNSSVFALMLTNDNFQEARTGRVRIRDCPQQAFKSFIAYLYGQESKTDDDGRVLWELADKVSRLSRVGLSTTILWLLACFHPFAVAVVTAICNLGGDKTWQMVQLAPTLVSYDY
jgi:hypothetical protein